MIRNLKTMGLALFAVLALGAIGAQSASATQGQEPKHTFTADSPTGTAILTGTSEGPERFNLTNAFVECEDVTYRGTTPNSENHIAVYPTFGDGPCKSNIGVATVHNNGCTYTFGSDTFENTTHYQANDTHATVSLACGHTGSITVTSGGCTIHVGTTHTNGVVVNHNLPGVRYVLKPNHSGGKTAITVEATVRTIKAETTGANCPLLGLGANGTHINGTYVGKAITTCYEDKGGTKVHPTSDLVEGDLVNCGLTTP